MSDATVFVAPHNATTVDGRSHTVTAVYGTPVEEHLSRLCQRLSAAHDPGFPHWWSVRRVELPTSSLGPARDLWIGCARWAGEGAVFAARDSYDAASRALLGELLEVAP